MSKSRDKFLDVATRHFAERGFYGVSIAQISTELGLSKQALLHHFGNKETLYGDVLKRVSDDLMRQIEASVTDQSGTPLIQAVFTSIYRNAKSNLDTTQLLVRELLDNKQRATTAQHWYLIPFLENLVDMVMANASSKITDKTQALSFVYHMIASIHYFLISGTTLTQMFGQQQYRLLENTYEEDLESKISSWLDSNGDNIA